jgi:hypothetical protein
LKLDKEIETSLYTSASGVYGVAIENKLLE